MPEDLYNYYIDFNDYVYHHFLEPNLHSFKYISSCFTDIKIIQEHKHFNNACNFLGQNTWYQFNNSNNKPLYFGLIALQLLAASVRENDELCTSQAYNPRLKQYLNLQDNNVLYQNYREAQEKIYEQFEKWCKKNDFEICLSKDQKSHRYVQYPLSLALLTQNDFSFLRNFFHEHGFLPQDEISYEQFWAKLQLHQGRLSSSIKNLLTDEYRKEAVKSQIYSFYMRWDGKFENELGQTVKTTNINSIHHEYMMYWNQTPEKNPEFFTDEENDKFRLSQGAFYVQSPNCCNDWIHISDCNLTYSVEWKYLFIYSKQTDFSSWIEKQYIADYRQFTFDNIHIILFNHNNCIQEIIQSNPLRFRKQFQIHLTGGLKFSFRNWMTGGGPIILLPPAREESSLLKGTLYQSDNHCITTIEPLTPKCLVQLDKGSYTLFYSSSLPPVHFQISAPEEVERFPQGGWILDKNEGETIVKDNAYIHGLNFSKIPPKLLTSALTTQNSCRLWMDLVMASPTLNSADENIIHKALRRFSNGIRNR